ncbi:MAG: aldo/keto reductase [Acidobacteriaceae bacterium]|nr:aldo/keto reductase [Acidobacteriaceae bacterium]
MHHWSRRDFLKSSAAAGAFALAGGKLIGSPTKSAATDWVTLGKSNVQVTRLAFGTGTFSGRVQRELGQAEFTRLVRYAYDRGIRFFETADSYAGMPQMLAVALKGLPRDSYRLMTKYNTHDTENPQQTIDRLRSDLNTEYVDVLLLHCVRNPKWPENDKKLEDAFSEAKQKKVILSHGASVHGLPALRAFPGTEWLDVAMIRMNQKGVRMDTPSTQDVDEIGNVSEVVQHVKQVHSEGKGVISMKLAGEGRFTKREDRQAAVRYAFRVAGVDAVTIGYKNTAEIDEAIENINQAFSA